LPASAAARILALLPLNRLLSPEGAPRKIDEPARPASIGSSSSGRPTFGPRENRKELLMQKTLSVGVLVLLMTGLVVAQAPEKAERSEAEKKALAKVRQLGGLALELAQNDPRLEVSYQQRDAKFSEEFLLPLKDLKGLVHLNLRGQDVTDAHLVHLKDLTSLTRLHLEKTKITDKGLDYLKGLTNLEYLNLYGTEVTDAGLVHLEGMKKLKDIYVWQTKVTDAGVAKLKEALPQVEIVRGIELDKPVEEKKAEEKKEDKKADDKKKDDKKRDDKKAVDKKADDKQEDKKKDDKKADDKNKDEKKDK
jgi:Leucine Rich repeat